MSKGDFERILLFGSGLHEYRSLQLSEVACREFFYNPLLCFLDQRKGVSMIFVLY